MFRAFLPKEVCFFDYFEQLAALSVKACQAFLELTEGHKDGLDRHAAKIKDIEHQADDVAHRCIDDLNKTFVTPIDRVDIHALIKRMDDVVDSVDATASRMALYELVEIREEARKSAEVLLKAVRSMEIAVRGLRTIKETKTIKDELISIYHLENEGDLILREALTRLFREETNAILVIKWKEIFERLEKATDRCEEIAHIIERIVIEVS
ncbi:MAG: DUF47 family protein [Candidatus Hydrogenedentes bacterium]|nr:DUF47 family protein [Candidatus Hydrogenedentota bacterium]